MTPSADLSKHPLPPAFITAIQSQLGPATEAFLATYNDPPTHGLRLNPAKITIDQLRVQIGWTLEPIPWCANGYYIDPAERPGSHPFHAAGLYYLQEPTAMAVAELADLQPGQTVLDVAASPGGKSTQISTAIGPTGLLIANEIHPARIKALGENLERWGATNTLITNRSPAQLASAIDFTFDRIIVDAPCSGEGLFRRDPSARAEWSPDRVSGCANRQLDIVRAALPLLQSGGRLTYSTCTFNRTENEGVIDGILAEAPDLIHTQTTRLWPHEVRGEGHTITVLRSQPAPMPNTGLPETNISKPPDTWIRFLHEAFLRDPLQGLPGTISDRNGRLMFERHPLITNAVRSGLWLGDQRPGRFVPSHALALAIDPSTVANRLDLSITDAHRWIAGESFDAAGPAGWTLITVAGHALGWGKRTGSIVKNHYPKGLRRPIPSH